MCEAMGTPGPRAPDPGLLLGKLTTLQIEPEMTPALCNGKEYVPSPFTNALHGLLLTPSLRTVRTFEHTHGCESIPAMTRELFVSGEMARYFSIVSSVPNLEKMTVRAHADLRPAKWGDPVVNAMDSNMFNDAVANPASTLKSLTVHTFRQPEFFGPAFGRWGRLTGLASFGKLEHLSCAANELLGLVGNSQLV
jgi:hypothetical protein